MMVWDFPAISARAHSRSLDQPDCSADDDDDDDDVDDDDDDDNVSRHDNIFFNVLCVLHLSP